MYRVLTLNNISSVGLEKLPRDGYEISSDANDQMPFLSEVQKCMIWRLEKILKQ